MQGLKPPGYAMLARVLNEAEGKRALSPEGKWLRDALRRVLDEGVEPLKALELMQRGRPKRSMAQIRATYLRDHEPIVRFIAERVEAGVRPGAAQKEAEDRFPTRDRRTIQRLWKQHGPWTLRARLLFRDK